MFFFFFHILISALRCGEISFNSSEVEFQCYDNSDEFGTVCWARCSYGYILRNDLQEEEQQAALAEIAETAAEDLENAEVTYILLNMMLKNARMSFANFVIMKQTKYKCS